MAGADTWLVISDLLQTPNDALGAATAGGGPAAAAERAVRHGVDGLRRPVRGRRCSARCWPRRRRAVRAALLTFVLAAVFDLLFFVLDELPATVPVALALIVESRLVGLRCSGAAKAASVLCCRRSRPAGATPRPAR